MTIALNELPAADFETLVGTTLPAIAAERPLDLLIEAVQVSAHPTGRAIPGFSVLLRSAPGPAASQGLVRISHPRHGELELFMTVIGRDARGTRYEILFN